MGFVMPSRFLKVAEDTNMITAIGEWVLRNACIFLKRLQQEGFGDRIVSVNVSKMQILQNDFVDSVMEIAEIADIDPRNLEIEVSEAILIEYYDMVAEKLNTLKSMGSGSLSIISGELFSVELSAQAAYYDCEDRQAFGHHNVG